MIPICVPTLGKKELDYVADCIKSNWISSKGQYVDEFERRFAEYCGCKYGVTTTSGTTAIHLGLLSIGLKRDDEVIVPSFTMIASVLPIIYCGAKPVLVDADPETWCMETAQIEKKINAKTKAIMPVHIYGHPCKMDIITEIARDRGLHVIEDAAEAHGAEYKGRKTGSIGDIGCFSFYANKIITCGEGGMIVTDNEEIAETARSLKNLSFPKGERTYLHRAVGYNYRMTNMQAAVGLAQLERIGEFVEMRRRNAKMYNDLLGNMDGITLPVEKEWAKNVYWMYSILIQPQFRKTRDQLVTRLKEKEIETRPFFIPMNTQPVFQDMRLFGVESYPVSEELSQKGLNLPSSSGLSERQIHEVCDAIKRCKQ